MIAQSEESFEIVDKLTCVEDNYSQNLYKISIFPKVIF